MTFMELARKVLELVGEPLTPSEIWTKADALGLSTQVPTRGRTPWNSIGAQLYVDLRNPLTEFARTESRPARFYLKEKQINKLNPPNSITVQSSIQVSNFNERDLHPLLVAFASNPNGHFKASLKTILHEKSSRRQKVENEWLHPDLVGVHYMAQDWSPEIAAIYKTENETQCRFYSFEMKKEVNFSNLREYFFQAVSNSSWANEGYLVSYQYRSFDDMRDELSRLNNAFGIGFIRLDAENVMQSEILYPAKYHEILDWDTINRLAGENADFNDFIKAVHQDALVDGKIHKEYYDKVMDEDSIREYSVKKHIL